MAKDEGSDFIGKANGATDNLPPTAAPPVVEAAAVEEVPNAKTQIVVNGAVMAAPPGFEFDRRLNIDGQNVEHVHDDEFGRWCYRSM